MNNLEDKLSIPKKIEVNKLRKLTFYTQEEYNEILYNEKVYEIAHILKYNYENGIDNSGYIYELKNEKLNPSFLKNTLHFMISRGIPQAVLLQKDFEINTKDIDLETFYEGFINGMNGLEDSEFLVDFAKMYKNPQELLEKIGEEIDFILLDKLIYNGVEFNKFGSEKIDDVLNNFGKIIKKEKLFDRINKIGFYDWYIICYELFENYELAYSKIKKIFNFTEEEKEEFEKLKQDNFFISYQTEIQKTIESFEDINFTKIGEYTYNDTNGIENNGDFQNKIQEVLTSLNYKIKYSIEFIDISGKILQFNIGNGIELGGYNYGLLEKEFFNNDILKAYNEFIENLEKNNMDFTILLFKENGEKDDIPDEENEDLLIAA